MARDDSSESGVDVEGPSLKLRCSTRTALFTENVIEAASQLLGGPTRGWPQSGKLLSPLPALIGAL